MTTPVWLREDGTQSERPPVTKHDAPPERLEERPLRCVRCGETITDEGSLFATDEDRTHRVFSNPAGLLCEILTARWTQNTVLHGPPTTDFTWFPGYAWEIAACAGCGSHLGWRFEAVQADREPTDFWGLLTSAIAQGP